MGKGGVFVGLAIYGYDGLMAVACDKDRRRGRCRVWEGRGGDGTGRGEGDGRFEMTSTPDVTQIESGKRSELQKHAWHHQASIGLAHRCTEVEVAISTPSPQQTRDGVRVAGGLDNK